MPFEIELEPGENLILQEIYRASAKSEPFAIAISDRALYLYGKKTFAVSDPYYLRRIPDRRGTPCRGPKTGLRWPLGGRCLMVVGGALATVWMMQGLLSGESHLVTGIPLGLLVAGLVLPFAARGRKGIVVTHLKGTFRWKPPLLVGSAAKQQVTALLSRIIVSCQQAYIPLVEEEGSPC